MKTNEILHDTVLEVVDNQILDLNPPATKETFDRLVVEGHDADEARRLIGCVVVSEIFDILKKREPFDEKRFVAALRNLPKLPE